jgi:U3 small nucleolar RNA-associated protein 24
MAELEKLGPRYRLALRIARDERWTRLKCDHKGVYADDCLVDRVMKHKIYLLASNDRDLKRRVRKIPGGEYSSHFSFHISSSFLGWVGPEICDDCKQKGCFTNFWRVLVPIISVARGKYVIERLPDAPEK